MLAKQKWQIKTIQALELVFAERERQYEQHGDAMRELPDGVGPDMFWLAPVANENATEAETAFRQDYEWATGEESLTRMHLVREELAEAFAEEGNSEAFLAELVQVAALCVQWVEYKLEDPDA